LIESEPKSRLLTENLPQSWIWTTLEDVSLRLSGGGTPSRQIPEYFCGEIVWLTPTEIPKDRIMILRDSKEKITQLGLQNSSAKLLPSGSVLLTSRATIGSVAIAGCNVTTNQGFASFVCTSAIYNFYLAYWLWANKYVLESYAKGTTFKEISKSVLRGICIPLAPLQEQHRIVSKLEELFTKLDTAIDSLKKTKILLKNYRQSILQYAFEGKLTEKWREVHRNEIEHPSILLERIKDRKKKSADNKIVEKPPLIGTQVIPELSDLWIWTSVGQLVLDARYGTSKKCLYETKGIPVLRIPNIIDGTISLQDLKYAHLSDNEKEALRLNHGDVVVIRTNGSLGLVGRSAVVTEIKEVTAFASYLIRLRPVIPVLGTFVNTYLRSKRARNFIERNARTTAGQHNINLTTLNSIPIPLPSVSEQNKIIELIQFQFSIIDNTVKVLENSLRCAEILRQSVLMTAFTGKLVPQDPTDEPASLLMKKIEERSKQDNKVKEKIRNKIDTNHLNYG
jgi:type I restriction enzyme, S subunit